MQFIARHDSVGGPSSAAIMLASALRRNGYIGFVDIIIVNSEFAGMRLRPLFWCIYVYRINAMGAVR